MKEEILDKIDRYLRKEMIAEEIVSFEQDLQKDALLREETELTKAIIYNLKDRQQKLERMKKWDRQSSIGKTNRKFIWISSIGIAASLLIGAFMIRFNDDSATIINGPSSSSYRGTISTHEIQRLITQGKNEQALVLIDSLEENYKMEAMQSHGKDSLAEEEVYELQVITLTMYELEWLRIEVLIADEQYAKAFNALDKYRMQEGDYQEKADSLWNELKERLAK